MSIMVWNEPPTSSVSSLSFDNAFVVAVEKSDTAPPASSYSIIKASVSSIDSPKASNVWDCFARLFRYSEELASVD